MPNKTKTRFVPYRGTEAQIGVIPITEGYVYFATDTGKIFLDHNGSRTSMGGSGASLFYANDTNIYQDLMDKYHIDFDSFADPKAMDSCKIDDLIINIDGSFYRIIEKTTTAVICDRIAVSGTGSGGGGTGGGGDITTTVELKAIDTVPYTYVYGRSYKIKFKATSPTDDYVNINLQVTGLNDQLFSENYQQRSGEEFELDVGKVLFQGSNKIVITATSDNATYAGEFRRTGINAIILGLRKDSEFNPRQVRNGTLPLSCFPVGSVEKKLAIYIDNIFYKEETINAATSDSRYTINIEPQAHGAHTIKAILYANINNIRIETDPIEYQIAWYENGNDTPLIWTPNGYAEEIIQYEDLVIEYMVWDPNKTIEIETHFYKGTEELINSPRYLSYDSSKILRWNITDYDIGRNNYTIRVGVTSKSIGVNVIKDEKRDLNIRTGGLVLNLDTLGRSNDENISSRTKWISKGTDIETAVQFNNFNWYNNGWLTDEDERSFLRISNGASISIPITQLRILDSNSQALDDSLSFEFRFKVRNVQEYSTLVTTESYTDENGKIQIRKTISSEKGVFGKLFNSLGLCLGTQEAFFSSFNAVVNARYREDEIVSVTFVIDNKSNTNPLLAIYLNGIQSNIVRYSPSSDSFISNADAIEFNSTYCDVDLYNVRIYKGTKLESADVVHNYIADKKDVSAYDANQIMTSVNGVPTIDFQKMIAYNAENPSETIMPYMVIESKDNILPYVKGGKKAVNIDFFNPALDYAYENGLIDAKTYLYGSPSFRFMSNKESLDVQGTSSQGYPIRNFKWKAKQSDASWKYLSGPLKGKAIYELDAEATAAAGKDKYRGSEYEGIKYEKYHLDNSIGETTYCLKADYMESSGTHNTGFASFVKTLYNEHPLQSYYESVNNVKDLRTTIYGFPILVFQKIGSEYKFIGRYNFNLDKGATDTCGFSYDAKHPILDEDMEKVAECWEFCNNQGQRCSFTKVDFNETQDSYVEVTDVTSSNWKANTYYIIDSINTNTGDKTYVLSESFTSGVVYYTKKSGILSVLDDFEYRYSAYEDEIDNAIDGVKEFAGVSQTIRNEAILNRMKNLENLCKWLNSTDVSNPDILGADLPEPIIYNDIIYEKDDKEYRLAKFLAEFKYHFNQEYCEVYFIMTELLHLYDSRGKNMMMASWGPTANSNGNYIWFPIFYDIDTQLGINNSGVPTWDYGVEPTRDNMFSTSNSVLWNNLWEVFSESIMHRYSEILRKGNLTIDNMDGYYNAYPIPGHSEVNSWKQIINLDDDGTLINKIVSYAKLGKRPIMLYNVDQYYKYIAPTVSGYINTSGLLIQDSGSFFYCLQGPRDLMRFLYLRNRINFVDSKWHGGAYSPNSVMNEFWCRYDANVPGVTSDEYLVTYNPELVGTSINTTWTIDGQSFSGTFIYTDENGHPLDAIGDFIGVKSYLQQYMSLVFDSKQQDTVYCNGKDSVDLMMPSDTRLSIKTQPGFSQQLVYIGGGEYISDLGDLSMKYLDELKIPTLKRLKNLQLGSDVEGYYNKHLSSTFVLGANKYSADGSLNENSKTLLERIILTNLNSLNQQIDLTGSEKLKEFRALGTIISGADFADGVQLETLHLPETITNLSLIEPVALSNILDTPKDGDNFNKGLYIESITNVNDYNKLIKLYKYEVVGGNMKYDSYKLLDKLVNFKNYMIKQEGTLEVGYSKNLQINLKNVNWSPYSAVEYGEVYDSNTSYYIDEGRFIMLPYSYTANTWELGTLNGNIYTKNEELINENSSVLTSLEILDRFIDTYEIALNEYKEFGATSQNYFTSTIPNPTGTPTLPSITGIMFVNNNANVYNEEDLESIYHKYFPNLKIFVNNVNPAYVATYVSNIDGKEEVIYTERISSTSANAHPTYPEGVKPVRLNYDFLGWSTNINGPAMTKEEIEAMTFSVDNNYIKFYAIFEIHKYVIEFYTANKNNLNDIELITTEYVPAGEYLYEPNIVPKTDESNLDEDRRYKFIGYVVNSEDSYPARLEDAKLVPLNEILSENMDRKYYACYIEESVFDSETNKAYFYFSPLMTYTDNKDSSYNITGVIARPNRALGGKITIPATDTNGNPVIAIGGFAEINEDFGENITHVYFMNPDTIRYIDENCFGRSNNDLETKQLKIFDWPTNLRVIEINAFRSCRKMAYLEKFKNINLIEIQQEAFSFAFDPKVELDYFYIPSTVYKIGYRAFANIRGGGYGGNSDVPASQSLINNICFGNESKPSEYDIKESPDGNDIFRAANTERAVPYYKNIYFYSPSEDYLNDASELQNIMEANTRFFNAATVSNGITYYVIN